jgi:hypothetical protein
LQRTPERSLPFLLYYLTTCSITLHFIGTGVFFACYDSFKLLATSC